MVDESSSGYDRIVEVEKLPRRHTSDGRVCVTGYAANIAGRVGNLWAFFTDLEPAAAFIRAGRMSAPDISSVGVHRAAREVKFVESRMGDEVTLYLGEYLQAGRNEETVRRWLRGVHPASSSYLPPERR
ncbi:hypothetical protein [Cellulomonas dongxiuzhuiae]|uniref:Uncharacterized protein n=1 Tax=Cellulomonas dongxiuzhuiae TaxID=2819979 RepID=A0ABX8GIW7_9CELL|nr:hypothetical protein [Cellulomonas dongxiuzhuiae]MBO3094840.1 hypothetical protein [Cellulomonas dongxiuzhuiae]QWC15873.1 hypothetical protein KKR89_16710 [Cellulomonas dongxiuzhuiae]